VAGNSRAWVQRLAVDGKRRNFGLGPWPVVSLAEAREIALDNVRKRQRGINLVTGRRRARTVPTFEQAADAYIALQKPFSHSEGSVADHRDSPREPLRQDRARRVSAPDQ